MTVSPCPSGLPVLTLSHDTHTDGSFHAMFGSRKRSFVNIRVVQFVMLLHLRGHFLSSNPLQQCKTAWIEVFLVFFARTCHFSLSHAVPSPQLAAGGFHGVGEDSSGKTSTISPMAVSEGSRREDDEVHCATCAETDKFCQSCCEGVLTRSTSRGGHVCSTGCSCPFGESSRCVGRRGRGVLWIVQEPELRSGL